MDTEFPRVMLPKSVRAFGTDEFKDTLREELSDQLFALDLDSYSDIGGDAEPMSASLDVLSGEDRGDTLVVGIMLSYTESRPSGCRDITLSSHHIARCTLTIMKESGETEADVLEDTGDWGR